MWVMFSDCFLSIALKDCGPDELLVRARRAGDIEKCFPDAKVITNTVADYLYRAVLPRGEVKAAIAGQIDDIAYPSFKHTVEDDDLYLAYLKVRAAMAALQPKAITRRQ
jgi:hypothetical protein